MREDRKGKGVVGPSEPGKKQGSRKEGQNEPHNR